MTASDVPNPPSGLPIYQERAGGGLEPVLAARACLMERSTGGSLGELLGALLDEAEGLTGSCLGFLHTVAEDPQSLPLQAWATRHQRARALETGGPALGQPAAVWADCLRMGHPLIHNDCAQLAEGASPLNAVVVRELIVPVRRSGRVVAVLGVANKATDYREAEAEAFQRLADLAWDLVDKKRAEEAQAASAKGFGAFFEKAPDAIFLADPDTKTILDANEAACRLLGRSREEIIGLDQAALHPPEHATSAREAFQRHIQESREQGFTLPNEDRILRSDGTTVPVEVLAQLVQAGGRTVLMGTFRDITGRKRLETMYRELLNSQGEGFGMVDADERFVVVNPVAEEIFGVAPGHLVGRCLMDYLPEDQAEVVRRESLRRPKGISSTYELRIRREDGTPRILLVTGRPWANQPEGERLVIGIFRDITERKEMEVRLSESEARFRTYIEQSRDVIFTLDAQGTFVFVSPAWERHFGFPASEVIGRPFAPFVHEDDVAPCMAYLTRVLSTGEAEASPPYRVRHANGSWRWFVANGALLPTSDGAPRFIGVAHDITEARLAEEALRESEEQLRIIFEASGAGIILVSPKGEIRFANRRMAEMFGMENGALIGTAYTDHLHPDEKTSGDRRMHQLIDGEIQSVSLERRYLRADGTEFWGHLSGRRLENVDGSLRALVGIITDITQRRQSEEQQRVLQVQLHQAQKMESLGSLAGGVAHDMNNVLGAILGLASAHIEAQPAGSPTQKAFGTIIKAAERGGNMLKSLLSFARQNAAEMRELDLNTILREEVRLLERTTLSKVRLVMELAPDLRPILGDPGALTHAFMNLSVNAVDAMPENGVLTLRTRNLDPGWVEVQVEDTGVGMAKEILEKALDPFFTTKEIGKGTGLGLSIVYSTVKTHRGQMDLHSEPGKGTCVTMRFPACEAPARAAETTGAYRTMASRGGLKVLMVDDDELIQTSMQGLLELLGHQPTLAPSGEEALAMVEAGLKPDVVILDMNMPGLGGAGTLPRLRALLPTVPVLLATGRADQTAQDLVEAHPFVTLLSKPFGMKELQAQLAPFTG
ncbi:hypothetical protein GETHLI_11910 [Geothrix limicola]|uniref:histidine kinase n=1 Tax=Geothrix limicola TaxID=2927978 RepID=A0ABQ5QF68_9BACT|nr:PAS domain S-box protein [Geothrix limicola]GLH72689.1 hypothetical protein GETHLI_11910 [Geothrix limicola]